MAKLVILKSLMDSYYDNMIEKSTTHKYIRRVPKSNGKGYNYFYPEDFKKPMKALLSFFGMKEDKIDNAYKNNNISEAYGVTKQGFAQHVLEYLTNRKTWNTFFANKVNRDRYKIPEKPVKETEKVTVSEKEIVGGKTKEKVTVEEKETKEKNFKSTWNRSLMRKIYSMYNSVPEDKSENNPGIDTIKVGDSVSYNGEVGKITKDFENGMMFVQFESGGMGRFFVKDLQKMNPTADEVTETATENAVEQNVNGTNEAVQETVEEYNNGSIVSTSEEKIGQKTYTKQDMEFWLKYSEDQLKDYIKKQESKDVKYQDKMVIAALKGAIAYKKIPDEVVPEEISETVKENPYNSVGADIVKDYTEKLNKIRNSDRLTEKQKTAIIANEHIPELIDIAVKVSNKTSDTKEQAAEKAKLIVDAIKNNMPENEQALFLNDYNFETLVDLRWNPNEHENRSQAMMGNQNARKYGNLSNEANEVIARQNLNVNEEGVVQPSVEEAQASAEFWNRNKAKNYRFQKDQYGNTYMIMDGLDGYFYDKDGKRVDGAEMVHERTYHDEYIPQEPHITIRHNGGMNEYIYLTPDMKADLELGTTDYQPVDSTYVKPEKETIREDYIDLQDEKTQDKLKNRTYQMNKLYDMAKKTGIQVMEYTGGMMSNHGKITHVVLPIGVKDQNSEQGMFIDKTDKVLVDYAKYLSENIEPTEKVEVKDELEKWQKNFLTAAFMAMKKEDPTMADIWYIEKLQQKVPQFANKVKNWSEIINNPDWEMTAEDIQKVRDFANGEDTKTESKNDAIDYYVSGDGMWINKYLRNPEEFAKEGGSVSEEEKQIIADLDKETTSTPITEKKLYRAVDASAIFGDISDGDFDDLVAHVVYGNNDKLIANKAGLLINRAENKQITEPGFMSTTKDREVADNWDGFTGSNKEVILELDIPDGMTGKDLAAYDVEGEEQKEVLLPRNTDYFIKKITQGENGKILVQAQVLGQHGNHIAMLGNQNARKYGLSEEDEQRYNQEYNWYKDTYVDGTRENNPYSNEEETIEGILKDEADSRFKTYGENDVAYLALKDLYIDETGKEYTPPAKEEVKPQTEKAMKKEEKKLEKARVDAGLPKPDMFERTSTIDDSTWDPKSKNYRFRDTGYIAGARKEQAALYITRSAKQGIRVDAKEIDWDGVEENPRQAEKLIVKSNIFGEVDWNGLREKGMSGSAAFLIDRIYASAGSKPSENNADARHNYVIALNGLRDRFEDCKTVEDVLNTLNEIQDEIRGEYVEVKNTPKYQELMSQIKANRSIAFDKKRELEELSEKSNKEYNLNYQKLVEKYIEKGKKEKKLHWNARMSRYNIPKEYEADFSREEREILSKANAPWKKAVEDFKAELKARGVPEESFYDTNIHGQKFEISWYDLYELMPEMREADRLGKELDEYVKGQKVVVAMKNPLLEAWKSLGSRFLDIKRSDSFAQHRYDAKKGKYDNWDWLEKEVKVKERKQSKEKKLFNLLVADSIERKGGRDMDISSTADLKKAFNLREVQSGNWVLKDPESAEFHVRNAARAFADLADITGIPDDKISLNGRLAMAFGARGTGNAGGSTAMAHYEHVERVINLTKFKGGGCLGHEWFHAFDNLLTCAMNGDDRSSIFLTNRFSNLTPATKELVLEYLKYKDSDDWSADYQRRKLAKKLAAKNFDVKELDKPQTDLQLKVQNAFDNLVAAMTTGDTEIKYAVEYSKTDYNNMLYNFKEENLKQWRDYDKMYGRSRPKMQVAIADAGNLSDAVKIINERYGDVTDKKTLRQKSEWVRLAAAYYDRNPNGNENDGKQLLVDSGKRGSQFLSDAFDLDENGAKSKDYWSSTHEMAARAFSAYIEDTLKEQGRQNDYLAYKSDNRYYMEGRPYPEGEERKRINAAFKKLFEVIRENNAIEKAVAIVDAPDFIIKNGRFLIRK